MTAGVYVNRPLSLGSALGLSAWALGSGISPVLAPSEMHVTLAYSRKNFQPKIDRRALTVTLRNPNVKPLGDKGALVLTFDSPELKARWKAFRDAGASWDYDDFHPHITLSYKAKQSRPDVQTLPRQLTFDGEEAEPIKDDFDGEAKHIKRLPSGGIRLGTRP